MAAGQAAVKHKLKFVKIPFRSNLRTRLVIPAPAPPIINADALTKVLRGVPCVEHAVLCALPASMAVGFMMWLLRMLTCCVCHARAVQTR